MGIVLNLGAVRADLNSLSVAPGQIQGAIDTDTTVATLSLSDSKGTDGGHATYGGAGKLSLVWIKMVLPLFESKGGQALIDETSNNSLPKPLKTEGVGGGAISGLLGPSTSLDIRLAGGLLKVPDILSFAVKAFIGPILQLIGDGIVTPLLSMLGIDVGLVKVQLIDVNSSMPVLRQ
jgi:hypothetical protein